MRGRPARVLPRDGCTAVAPGVRSPAGSVPQSGIRSEVAASPQLAQHHLWRSPVRTPGPTHGRLVPVVAFDLPGTDRAGVAGGWGRAMKHVPGASATAVTVYSKVRERNTTERLKRSNNQTGTPCSPQRAWRRPVKPADGPERHAVLDEPRRAPVDDPRRLSDAPYPRTSRYGAPAQPAEAVAGEVAQKSSPGSCPSGGDREGQEPGSGALNRPPSRGRPYLCLPVSAADRMRP